MTCWTKVLAVTDLSEPALHATERAAMFSAAAQMGLELLHVADLAPLERMRVAMKVTPDQFKRRLLARAVKALDDLASSIHQRFGVSAHTRALAGTLLAQLAKEMDTLDNGLLVCGAVGEASGRFGLGVTALRVLSTSACPVLVVKRPPVERYQRVVVPLDMASASPRIVQQARAAAPDAELVLLHVVEVPFAGHLRYAGVDEESITRYLHVARHEAFAYLSRLADQVGLPDKGVHLTVMQGDPLATIVQVERELGCDLVVMGKYGEDALAEFLLGSLTKRVLASATGDVLVCA